MNTLSITILVILIIRNLYKIHRLENEIEAIKDITDKQLEKIQEKLTNI